MEISGNMEISGKVKKISKTKILSKGFRKRELVLTTEEQYPQHLLIEFIQGKTELLNSIYPNDKVKISINLRGREWINPEGIAKYFNSIQGWKIEKINETRSDPKEEFDDLPF